MTIPIAPVKFGVYDKAPRVGGSSFVDTSLPEASVEGLMPKAAKFGENMAVPGTPRSDDPTRIPAYAKPLDKVTFGNYNSDDGHFIIDA